jgi:hypothetical protein
MTTNLTESAATADFDVTMDRIKAAEENLHRLYGVAYELYNRGLLSPKVRTGVHRLRDAVYRAQMMSYTAITTAFRALASGALALTPLAVANWSAMLQVIPRPQKLPDLPPANVGAPPAQPLSHAVRRQPRYKDPEAGEGATTNIWVIGIVAVLVIGAGATIVAVVGIDRWMQVQQYAIQSAEETTRYLAQLQDTAQRYFDCLDRGESIAQCVGQFPTPDPPAVSGGPGRIPWGWMAGGALVAVGGWFFFRSEQGQELLERWRQRRMRG